MGKIMVLRTRDELRDSLRVDDSSALPPEFSVNPRQTDFTDNTWGEEIGSVFRVENDITSFMVDESLGVDNTPDDNFNVFDEIKGTEYQDNAEYFMDAYNQPMFDALKIKLKREQKDRMMMERGGWSSMGLSFVAAVLSPTSFIPGTLAARSAKLGYSTSKSALTVGSSGFAATSLQELALQETQGLRTTEESLLNIGFGTVFSGGIGAGLAGLSNRGIKSALARKLDMAGRYSTEFAEKLKTAKGEDPSIVLEADAIIKKGQLDEVKAMAELSDELKAKIADETDEGIAARMNELLPEAKAVGRDQNSVGAAAYGPALEELDIYGTAGSAAHKATKWFNAGNRTVASPSLHTRKLAGNLFESPVFLKMNEYADSPVALETALKIWMEARLPEVIRKMGTSRKDGIFAEMRKAGINMTPLEYRQQIARAMRRNDGNIMKEGVDTGEPSGEFNPFIMKAAKVARDELFERARKELNEVGYDLKSKGSKTADSYLTRLWNRRKLLEKEADFKAREGHVWNYVRNAIDAQINDVAKKYDKKITNLRSEIDELKLGVLRRESSLNERVGPVLQSEYAKLNDIKNQIEQLEKALEEGSSIPDEFGQVFENIAARILPEDVRVQMVDEIKAGTGERFQQGSVTTDTPEFKKWSDGAPLIRAKDAAQHKFKSNKKVVVEGYHGTSGASDIKEFDLNKQSKISPGFYFTPDADLASAYSRSRSFDPNTRQKGGAVYPVYMTFKKPLVLDADGWGWDDLPGHVVKPLTKELGINKNSLPFDTSTIAKIAKEKGYDGVIVKNVYDSPGEDLGTKIVYIAFESTQIKSINNRGTFDPNDPRILNQLDSKGAQGSFNPVKNLISVARDAIDPTGTLKHESIHALKSMNLFQPEEWSLLETTAHEMDWVKKHNIESRYADQFQGDDAVKQERMLEEAIAEEFSQWRRGEVEVSPEVLTIFERIKSILGQIADTLKLSGIEDYNDIFKMIDDGEIAARSRVAKEQELESLQKQKRRIEQTIDRLEGGEELEPDVGLEDVQALLDIARGDKDKPKKPQTLTQFLKARGGLIDESGELKSMGITPKTHQGFVKPAAESLNTGNLFGKSNKSAASFDDAGLAAWEEGFFSERPTVGEFLDAIGRDLEGDHVVRQGDEGEYSLYQDFLAVQDELARLGIDPAKPRANFSRTSGEADAVQAAARIMNAQTEARIKKLEQKINEAEMKHNEQMFKHELDPDGHVDEIVSSIYNKLTNRDYHDLPDDLNTIDFGYLKGRTFGIKDELIEEFLEDDIELIMRSYVRNVAGQIEMKKRFGNIHLSNHFSAIAEEYDALRANVAANDNLTEAQKNKQLKKLDKKEKSDIRDLKFARDKILGNYEHDVDVTNWSRSVDMALQLQYMAALGGVLLTSSLDAFRHPMTQGFGRIFGKALPQLIAGNKTFKMNKEIAKKYAGIAEIIGNHRLAHMAGLSDPSGARSPAEVAIRKMVEGFSKLTGLPYWNQFHKEFAGAVLIDRILENMVKGMDNLKPNERAWMHNIGLGDMSTGAQRMLADGTIQKMHGVWTIDPEKLPRAVSDRFFAAVKKEIDVVIVSKGMGDAPVFMETPIGSMIGQFKSFGAASNQRMLIRGLQDDTGKFVGGLAGMVTAGMFVYALKSLEAGREIDDNPGTWIAEGLDRSGIFFLFFEANNIWEKMGGYGAYQAIGAKAPASRFATRNTTSALMGPVFGSVNDLVSIFGNGARLLNPNAEFDPTPGDVKSLRRVLPYASLPYWRWLVDGYIVPSMQDEVR